MPKSHDRDCVRDSVRVRALSSTVSSFRPRGARLSALLAVVLAASCTAQDEHGLPASVELGTSAQPLIISDIDSNFLYAEQQVLKTENRLANTAHPRDTPTDFQGGQWVSGDKTDWRSGFFNGTEWMIYEALGDHGNAWKSKADGRTRDFVLETTRVQTHDIGFKTLATYGQAFRLTGLEEFRPKIFEGANTLALRYLPLYGVTRSWDDTNGDVRVIIDNMMNIEVLFMAADLTSNTTDRDRWLGMAVSHATKTEQNHLRDSADPAIDGSSCHVFYYNLGVCHTWQGLSDTSTWTRGQGWAVYGFTMAYRYAKRWPQYATEAALFLTTAQRAADLYLLRLAEPKNVDWVPLHDFDAAMGATKDTSAAAITASALIELSANPAVLTAKRATYKAAAENILDNLRSTAGVKPYRSNATAGDLTKESIILRATGSNTTAGGGVKDLERSLSYADYFFVEGMLRYKDIYGSTPKAPGFLSGSRGASSIDLTWTATRGAASYTVKRGDLAAGPFTIVGTSTDPRFTDSTVAAGQPYFYVVTATNLFPAESGNSNVTTVYSSADVGSVLAAGSSSEASGTYTVRGSGADIWLNADAFRYTYKPMTGNGTVTVRVASLQNTNGFAKAGIMMREDTTAGSRNVFLHLTPTAANGYRLQSRTAPGGATVNVKVGSSVIPAWLRLVRSGTGSTFTATYSTNGTTWNSVGTVTVAMPSSILVGLAVTSHADGTLSTSTFDNVTLP